MRPATMVFSEWAEMGKDSGMEKGHFPAVNEILASTFEIMGSQNFRAIDAGCGNGWVVRMLSTMKNCEYIIGVDGADAMISKACEIDKDGDYICADLESWSPEKPVGLVHSMEVLYYLEDIPSFLHSVRDNWLQKDGILAFGIDHYYENDACHDWSEKVGVVMAMLSESEWREMVEGAGFEILRMFRANQTDEWAGTLAIIARKRDSSFYNN